MRLSIEDGWLPQARRVRSPNCEPRPAESLPSLLVIHNISLPPGCYGGNEIERLFTNCLDSSEHPFFSEICDLRVSSHLLIRRDGSLVQFVSLAERAWHAGVSCYQGRENCNDFSIGIELEGTDHEPYEAEQYAVLADVATVLVAHYPTMNRSDIAGHSDIAPGRKSDPGPAFDWERFRSMMSQREVAE